MDLSELDFALPPELIAQSPPARRAGARLMAVDRRGEMPSRHLRMDDLGGLLRPGDLLVVNDTRVLPARVFAMRDTGGRVEVLFLHPVREAPEAAWAALLRAGGRPQPGEVLTVAPGAEIELCDRTPDGSWIVRTHGLAPHTLMQTYGVMPLPPYIQRASEDPRSAQDKERYQTVYATNPGAVAAPTAGLHLSQQLLESLAAQGISRTSVTLHVGRGTFEPVRTASLDDHPMHTERYHIPDAAREAIAQTRAAGGRVVAVGTTSVRALEAAAVGSSDGLPVCGAGETNLLIQPGFTYQVVDALLTNFHLPKSTLLAMVSAFAHLELIHAAYADAIARRYRFFSYGDAMFLS